MAAECLSHQNGKKKVVDIVFNFSFTECTEFFLKTMKDKCSSATFYSNTQDSLAAFQFRILQAEQSTFLLLSGGKRLRGAVLI